MSSTLKQDLLSKISATEDEELLYLLNEDYEYFTKNKSSLQAIENLSSEQKEELTALFSIPFGNDTETYEDFKKATERWRIK